MQIDVIDEITAEMADTVSRYVAAYPNHSIEMEVDTIGGDWAASLSIFTSLTHHRHRVTALIQKASSGGALIVMAADFRQLNPQGHFFLHRPHGNYPAAKIDEIANAKAALMSGRCRVPVARIRRWMDATTTIDATRALAAGLVDEVPGLPKPKHLTVFL